jgi:type IV secretory pathway VirB4 component
VLLVCLFGALQNVVQMSDSPTICVVDEAWAVLANPLAATFLQSFFKLARSLGVSNLLVAHRPSDLLGINGDVTSAANNATELSHVRGLLADCETVVSYALSPREAELAQGLFGINDRQCELLSALGRGVALWRVARRTLLVRHQMTATEMGFADTDERMRL